MKIRKMLVLLAALCLLVCGCANARKEALQNGNYTVELTMSGGSGRAHILSPAALEVQDGQLTVTLIWSSSNYDYMIVDGVKYEPVTYEGGSTFRIPLKNLEKLDLIGDTVAMSTPHEVEYSLTFGTPAAVK